MWIASLGKIKILSLENHIRRKIVVVIGVPRVVIQLFKLIIQLMITIYIIRDDIPIS